MSKPLGYYTSHTPGTDSLLNDMEESFGSYFESLNETELLLMLNQLSQFLFTDNADGEVGSLCELALNRAENELSVGDKLGLIQFLVARIKTKC